MATEAAKLQLLRSNLRAIANPFTVYCDQYSKCPKISYTRVANKVAYANSVDTVQEHSDRGLHCLPFH